VLQEEIRQAEIDHVVVGGDVLPGPMPRETLAYLLDLEIPVQYIFGNGEIAVLEQMAGKEPTLPHFPFSGASKSEGIFQSERLLHRANMIVEIKDKRRVA